MREVEYLRQQAGECRAAAEGAETLQDKRALKQLANYYEKEAAKLNRRGLGFLH